MKIRILIAILLLGLSAHARFVRATVVFRDGHSEEGLISSFLEEPFVGKIFPKLEDELNLYDTSVKFKTDENAEPRTISSDDIDEITLHYNNHDETYKALINRTVHADGRMNDSKHRLWLPLLRRGKVNLYGYFYKEMQNHGYGSYDADSGFVFYFQNAKTDYVLNGTFLDNFCRFAVYSKTMRELAQVFLNNLLPDCPKLAEDFNSTFLPEDKGALTKAYRQEMKIRKKEVEAKKLGKVEAYYEINFPDIENLLNQYEAGCPN